MAQQRSEPETLKTLSGILMVETLIALGPGWEKGDPEAFRALHNRLEHCEVLKRLARTYTPGKKEYPRLMILFALWLFPRQDKLPRTRSSLTRVKQLVRWIEQQRKAGTADPGVLTWCSQMCAAAEVAIRRRQHSRRGRQTEIPRLDGLWLASLAKEFGLQGIRPVYDSLAELLKAIFPRENEREDGEPELLKRLKERVRYVRKCHGKQENEDADFPRRLRERVRYVRKNFGEWLQYWYDECRSGEALTLFKEVELQILQFKQQ